ncbi:2OG-Fe(II) oxygenase family protein [Colwelliaceae bacterium 6471]
MNLSIANKNSIETLVQCYREHGYVKVPNALVDGAAEEIFANISTQEQWNLVFDHNGTHQDLNNIEVAQWEQKDKDNLNHLVNEQAAYGFQYFYETIPIYDIFHKNLMPGHFFNEIVKFLNCDLTLDFFRNLTCAPEITFADAQITRFSAGHFLNCHRDDVDNKNRIAAFVINLTKDWRADWGGALHILNDDMQIEQSFLPTFNEINIFKIPVEHYVGYVTPFTKEHRLSITGWLRSGKNPMAL